MSDFTKRLKVNGISEMKVGFASNDWSRSVVDQFGRPVMGGSGHIRIGQYMQRFKELGYDACVGILAHNRMTGTFGIHTWDEQDFFDCDVIVMQRYMHMQVLPDMKGAQAAGQIILQDVDDWYWGLSEKNHAYQASNPNSNPQENVNWYQNIIAESDGIIASTPFLLNQMSKWNENVLLHTNYVDRAKYKDRRIHSNTDKMVVGWMGSTAHRSGDLEILRPHSDKISQFATWHHTGHLPAIHIPQFEKEIGVSAGIVSRSPFLPPTELHKGFKFDAGIVPLTDIPFNHAKSYIKGLEYACGGVPFVASYSPQYEELVEEHGIGKLARNPKDYVKLLKDLTDLDYRQDQSDKAWRAVKKFDLKVGAPKLWKTIGQLKRNAKR